MNILSIIASLDIGFIDAEARFCRRTRRSCHNAVVSPGFSRIFLSSAVSLEFFCAWVLTQHYALLSPVAVGSLILPMLARWLGWRRLDRAELVLGWEGRSYHGIPVCMSLCLSIPPQAGCIMPRLPLAWAAARSISAPDRLHGDWLLSASH